jgi:hypothetical protein
MVCLLTFVLKLKSKLTNYLFVVIFNFVDRVFQSLDFDDVFVESFIEIRNVALEGLVVSASLIQGRQAVRKSFGNSCHIRVLLVK